MTEYDFPPTLTRIRFGRGLLDKLGEYTRPCGGTALLVCGHTSARGNGALGQALASLEAAGVRAYVIDGITPQSTAVDAAAAQARATRADVIVGIGGGSVLDAAKATAVAVAHGPSGPLVGTILTPHADCLPVVAVPTTAGSGAEVTKGAIITDTARGLKSGIRGFDVFPKIALVDPALTDTQPRGVAMTSGFDAVTHAIEALAARSSRPHTDTIARQALDLLPDALRRIAAGHCSSETRDRMAFGAVLGGILVASASTCLPHRMQQAMGTPDRPGPTHGQGLALLYPAWLESLQQAAPEAAARVADALRTDSTREAVAQLLTLTDLRRSLRSVGYGPEDIPGFVARITGNIDNDPHPDPDTTLITSIYERAL
ncbi:MULTISPECIES: iron-containing alcohol dehydrogenase [unclassified Streptomyces]|uniref:iron-containing alcohol dehydrogenase n=1 Tax=unclassified Streptomyces TaxID=2593676 RepID=UPI0006B06CA0|nr:MULTISPECIES: iron-containing alcohol dehydrogenase [unclassified Streptomyces]